jgi:hypothetical protein
VRWKNSLSWRPFSSFLEQNKKVDNLPLLMAVAEAAIVSALASEVT